MRFLSRFLPLALTVAALASPAAVQAQTNHTTNITLTSLVNIPTAKVCAVAVDGYSNRLTFSEPGWGLVTDKTPPFCAITAANALSSGLNVPDACHSNRATPLSYNFTIQPLTSGQPDGPPAVITGVPNVCGATWSFDDYAQTTSTVVPSANLADTGPGVPPSCTSPSMFYQTVSGVTTLYACNDGAYLPVAQAGTYSAGTTAGTFAAGNDPRILASLKYQGTYSNSVTYNANDVVSVSGLLYQSLAASNLGHIPSSSPSFWKAITTASGIQSAPAGTSRIVYDRPYFDSSWNLDFTTTGAAPTLDGQGGLVFSPTNGVNFDASAITLAPGGTPYYTVNDHLDIRLKFVFTASGNGIYAGRYASTGQSFTVQWNPATQQLIAWQQGAGAQGSTSLWQTVATTLNPAPGDALELLIQQRAATIQATLTDANGGGQAVARWTSPGLPNPNNTFNMPSSSVIKAGVLGGTFTVTQLAVASRNPQNPLLLIAGDSKTALYAAGSDRFRFGSLLPFGPVSVFGGPGDRVEQLLNAVPDIIAEHPQNVMLSIGSNSVRVGESLSTTMSGYAAIHDQLHAAGIVVSHIATIPEIPSCGGVDQTALRAAIIASYGPAGLNETIIDPTTLGWSDSLVGSDCVHPNKKGHAALANGVVKSGVFSGTTSYDLAESGFGAQQGAATGAIPGYKTTTVLSNAGTIPTNYDLVYGAASVALQMPNYPNLTATAGPQPEIVIVGHGASPTLTPPAGGQLYANGAVVSNFIVPTGMRAEWSAYGEASGGGTGWNLVAFGPATFALPLTQGVSVSPSPIAAQACADTNVTVEPVAGTVAVTVVLPPSAYGPLSLSPPYLYNGSSVVLHYCNPTTSTQTPPSGTYLFKFF